MKILIDSLTNRVLFMDEDNAEFHFSDSGLVTPSRDILDVSPSTHSIISADPPPAPLHFIPGALAYNGEWSIYDQQKYDKFVDAAIAESERIAEQIRQASVPDAVPALEALLALDAAGLSADYEAWANDPARTFAQRAFINKALTWRRDDPTLQAAAEALELSSEQVDQLFISADQALKPA